MNEIMVPLMAPMVLSDDFDAFFQYFLAALKGS